MAPRLGRRGVRIRLGILRRRRPALLGADHGDPRLCATHRRGDEPGAADHCRDFRLARQLAPWHHRLHRRGAGHRVRAGRRHRGRATRAHRERDRASAARRHALHPKRRLPSLPLPVTPRDQHLATRRAAGLFDFSFMGLFEFRGTAELERLQSRDLSDIEPGRAAYTLLLNEDGSVFNDATVWNMGKDRWWLFSGRPSDIAWLGAAPRDRSGEHAILALQGPASGRILARLVGEPAVRALRYFRFAHIGELVVARLGYSGELGYE